MWKRIGCAAFVVLAAGCSEAPPPPPSGPLTVDEWKKIESDTYKYDPATLDQLRQGDPKLKDDKAWDEFVKTVVMPERASDIPQKTYAY